MLWRFFLFPYFYSMILPSNVSLGYIPKRIVSLVPSQTELLHALQLSEETIAITKFCVHPSDWFTTKTRIGGTKAINIELISQLQPDLIIANKEENVREQVLELAEQFPVWLTDVSDLKSAKEMILDIGMLTGKTAIAEDMLSEIEHRFSLIHKNPMIPKIAYLIWKDPYITVGGDTFISDMLHYCGFENIFKSQNRYPEVTINQLKQSECDLLFLSSEPYPFGMKHIESLQEQLPGTSIHLVDGEMFSWYGSRLLFAPSYFNELVTRVFDQKLK